jgi:hypothetical protein
MVALGVVTAEKKFGRNKGFRSMSALRRALHRDPIDVAPDPMSHKNVHDEPLLSSISTALGASPDVKYNGSGDTRDASSFSCV